jgi:hypothetical protein
MDTRGVAEAASLLRDFEFVDPSWQGTGLVPFWGCELPVSIYPDDEGITPDNSPSCGPCSATREISALSSSGPSSRTTEPKWKVPTVPTTSTLGRSPTPARPS